MWYFQYIYGMQDTLTIGLIQTNLHWENPEANRHAFTQKIKRLFTNTNELDLIILPEMFTTGFSMSASTLAETPDGATLKWMKETAKKYQLAITGSLIIKEGENFFNRLYFVFPNGDFQAYDKRHTFTLAGEDKVYKKGKNQLIITYKGWKICPLICYDLRFPVWARNTVDYDVLLYVANWPHKRITAWDTLLKARAIENMCYTVGVNRIGKDANKITYTGHSAVYNVLGETLFYSEKEETTHIQLDKNHIKLLREKLGFLNDRDEFIIKF